MSTWNQAEKLRQSLRVRPLFCTLDFSYRPLHSHLVAFIWLLWQHANQKRRDKLAKVSKELGDNKVIAELAARDPEMREALRSMGVRQMVLKEYGVYCVKCKTFIRINTYEFDPPMQPAPDVSLAEGGQTLRCDACGDVCVYRQVDIVHRSVN